jgi:hypothetical protein
MATQGIIRIMIIHVHDYDYIIDQIRLFFSIHDKQMFRNMITTDGYTCSLHFSRKKLDPKEPYTCDQDLKVDDFTSEEIMEFFRPCAVDPGAATLMTAAYGTGYANHEVRSFSNREYYAVTGSKRRNHDMNKAKTEKGISTIESQFPTSRTVSLTEYQAYLKYFFENSQVLRDFYSFGTAAKHFKDYQGRQRAIEETGNLLINGGKKYDRKRRKKRCPSQNCSKRTNQKAHASNRKEKRKKRKTKKKQNNIRQVESE